MSKASFSTGLRIVGAETSVNAKKKKKMQKGEKLRNVVYKIGIIKFSLNEKMIYLYQVFFLVVIIKFIVKMFNRWLRFNSNNQGI
jgi:cell division protein FtsL